MSQGTYITDRLYFLKLINKKLLYKGNKKKVNFGVKKIQK